MPKLFLVCQNNDLNTYEDIKESKYILTSFYYVKKKLPFTPKMHLVDSGAFTMFSSKKKIDLDEYVSQYINYINENDIKYFFELDLDTLIGYDKVLEIRKRIEKETGKQCIPVWHISRGKEEFIKMCKEYKYAGIGGIVSKENIVNYKHLYQQLNKLANSYGCKLHGLGYTGKDVATSGFYSVDSTSWLSGSRFAQIHYFTLNKMEMIRPKNKRLKKGRELNKHNLKEWIKFQKYLDNQKEESNE